MIVGATGAKIKCTHEPRNGSDVLVLTVNGTAGTEVVLDAQGPGRLRLEVDADNQIVCHGERGAATATAVSTIPAPGDTTTRIGLVGATARFHSVTVIGTR
jgi:hypothetical protein